MLPRGKVRTDRDVPFAIEMTLPGISINRAIARRTHHVNADRTKELPPSITRAHVDYNYPRVITAHTTVFQRPLTAVRPPYSAKLVFPFSVEERGTGGRGGKKEQLAAATGCRSSRFNLLLLPSSLSSFSSSSSSSSSTS